MKLFRLLLPLVLLVSILAVAPGADANTSSDLVITAITADMGGGTTQEWFELANVSGHALSVTGLRLRAYTSSSCFANHLTMDIEIGSATPTASFAKGEHKVFGTSAAQTAGVTYDQQIGGFGEILPTNGSLIVTTNSLGTEQDRVSWGTATSCPPEGSAAAALPANSSIVRDNRSTCPSDTDNNSADFSLVSPDTAKVTTNDGCDTDSDDVGNNRDNCASTANADQADSDGDGAGNACDGDDDNDTVPDASDNCPSNSNLDQADLDTDDVGDVCDPDEDGDTFNDDVDPCPRVPAAATEGCPDIARTVTLKYSKSKRGFTGVVTPSGPCAAAESVSVIKQTSTGETLKGTAQTDGEGVYLLKKARRPGKYLARVTEKIESDTGRCLAVDSPIVKIR